MLRRLPLFCCVLLALLLGASPASATHVGCGDVITQDTTLDSDLVNCPGDGLVIGASGITLDLAGHLIDGATPFTSLPTGVANVAGHDGVTVTGGTITDFPFFAVEIRKAQGGLVSHIVTPAAILLVNSPDIRIENNTAASVDVFGDSDRVVIVHNRIASRPPEAPGGPGGAIALHGGFPTSPPPAFPDEPTGSPEDTLVDRNDLLVEGFGGGILLSNAPSPTVTRNSVTATNPGDFDSGIKVSVTFGPIAPAVIERNDLSGTTNGIQMSGAAGAAVIRNTVSDVVEDGIVASNSLNALIDRNRVERSGDDGIEVRVAPATISRNTANFNGDLGIEAFPGAIDGGGNKAAGNGNPAQCVNVSCK